ncbi:MAG: phosphoribosylaminoimidazolecarboxamide formyltransferase [Candidatus Tectimicrobiota bacterium]
MEMPLRYGLNPHQTPARLLVPGDPPPLQVLNGRPGYVNMLDALGAWQLVRELRLATGLPSAASFKHTSPAGAAVARPLTETFRQAYGLPAGELSPIATAYARARGGDRVSSYGDAVAVSDTVDLSLARLLQREVSDLLIAPGYDPDALALLKTKKNGAYLLLQMDPAYTPPEMENRELFGLTLQQKRNTAAITRDTFANVVTKQKTLPEDVLQSLIVATIALKYTQSNSICVAYDGQVIGMGAGQQSRIHCTRLACDKADKWLLQQHPRVVQAPFRPGVKRVDKFNLVDQYLMWEQLSQTEEASMLAGFQTRPLPLSPQERADWLAQFAGICLSSDAFIPFRDNVDRASRSHVQYIAQTGGALREEDIIAAAEQYGMTMILTGVRLFLH